MDYRSLKVKSVSYQTNSMPLFLIILYAPFEMAFVYFEAFFRAYKKIIGSKYSVWLAFEFNSRTTHQKRHAMRSKGEIARRDRWCPEWPWAQAPAQSHVLARVESQPFDGPEDTGNIGFAFQLVVCLWDDWLKDFTGLLCLCVICPRGKSGQR